MTSAHEREPDGPYLTPVEVRQQLGVSPRTLVRYRAAGRIVPAFTLPNGHARFRQADVDKLKAAPPVEDEQVSA